MEVGDALMLSDLVLPAGVTAVSEPDTLIANLTVAKVSAEDEEDEAEAATDEPEVIGGQVDDEDKDGDD